MRDGVAEPHTLMLEGLSPVPKQPLGGAQGKGRCDGDLARARSPGPGAVRSIRVSAGHENPRAAAVHPLEYVRRLHAGQAQQQRVRNGTWSRGARLSRVRGRSARPRAVEGIGHRGSMREAMDGRRSAACARAWACKHELQLQRAARRGHTRVACSGRRARCEREDDCALIVSGQA
jgi:hypothetical protein